MKSFNLVCLILAVAWSAFLAKGINSIPPVGKMLSVSEGVWAHRPAQLNNQRLEGLKEAVTVTFDQAGVPHFFAANENDLFMAQGFVMASQRLFQMDLITRITAGRLSEWFGERTQKTDEFFVKFGMRESGRRTLETFNQDAQTANLLNAFAAGVNAYISAATSLPPEYQILGVKPERWDVSRTVHMGKQLTFGLAGRSYDHYLSRIQQQLGTEKVLDLFPEFTEIDDFVYPSLGKARRRAEGPGDFNFVSKLKDVPFFPLPAAGNGSNNWAVSAKKSTTGASIMANDTHLGHTLPNVWFEVQLSVPEYNVYGVALTAIPGIVNGFNSKVSWGPTNGTTDVLDYFEVEFENETSLRYRYGDSWLDSDVQEERIGVRGESAVTLQVPWTKFGVIVHREGKLGLAAAWRGHHTQQELRAIHSLFAAKNVDECMAAFGVWSAPVQNFICADRHDVAIQPVGFLPKRKIGAGRFIMEGDPKHDILETPITEAEKPKVVRPQAGHVSSANQRQSDPYYPYYLGWDFEEPYRGIMIHRRLKEREKFSPEDMINMQNDDFDPQAELALPLMILALDEKKLTPEQAKFLDALGRWDYRDLAAHPAPGFFKEWFEQFKGAVFGEEYKVQSSNFLPKDGRFIELLRRLTKTPGHADAQWVDNKLTPEKETLGDLALQGFTAAWVKFSTQQGPDPAGWNFKNWVRTRLPHVARLPGFGSEILAMNGGGESIRGNQGGHGAVYKIVVAHGDWPRAWISVPGGNEGDPFSVDYERGVREWADGKMRPVEFYPGLDEAKAKASRILVLER